MLLSLVYTNQRRLFIYAKAFLTYDLQNLSKSFKQAFLGESLSFAIEI